MRISSVIMCCLCVTTAFSGAAFAQGQDSEPWERDLQVIRALLAGGFDNANQSYFDVRGKRANRHRRLHVDVEAIDLPEIGDELFAVTGYWDNHRDEPMDAQLWSLSADADARAVRMRVWQLGRGGFEAIPDQPYCDLLWLREAAQFRAGIDGHCDLPLPTELVLSERQLWMTFAEQAGGDYQLHRVRPFKCYADIPGVGGGVDEPYERYGEFALHDQGGTVWFTSKEGRELGISLLLVDWPINNYEGVFTRDSFVVYVSEKADGERKEHGYAFTVPDADRIGINLKWMLVLCYMKSNRDATPSM